ncbi:DUF1120 domain-containing protein [Serratia sp. (in: enterobacteria)]|uniref:DUF1120 domain-containing protein n=1 Tax=Serratia sp. (in: enterobacteria) TaxID=616 RepID=UPI003988A8FE
MKKTIVSGAVVAAMMMSMGGAMAAAMSSELSVKGHLAIPSCQVSLAKNGVFDLGKISNAVIETSKSTPMKEIAAAINVECEADTFLNFSAIDNRAGTASTVESTHFGLGNVNGTGKLGYYKMRLIAATVDRVGVSVYSASKGSTSLSSSMEVLVDKDKVTGWANSENAQASGKNFQAFLMVEPVLASSKEMGGPITDSTKLDGSATLNFSYAL